MAHKTKETPDPIAIIAWRKKSEKEVKQANIDQSASFYCIAIPIHQRSCFFRLFFKIDPLPTLTARARVCEMVTQNTT